MLIFYLFSNLKTVNTETKINIHSLEKVKIMLSAKQAGEQLGLTTQRVSQLIREGKIKAVKVGSSYMIRQCDLNRFIKLKAKKNPVKGGASNLLKMQG